MKVTDLLNSPEKWIKGTAARDRNGDMASPRDSGAVAWCLLGSIQRCYEPADAKAVEEKVIRRLFGTGPRKLGQCLSVWNDWIRRKFTEVRGLAVELDI